ncbi:META domain-containing protein [Thalassotalea euphylliae]|uniref:META domain-containing protein n=1 Tax=Thalassotalea euphylliae TaxID=1655234 RepID=A0A3E0UKB3_9GAMM|nr:META domain-containing protein [Thalassotalea euphylliae]REL37087.1 META domain-containing protein [Thalassotalea euphylliae]
MTKGTTLVCVIATTLLSLSACSYQAPVNSVSQTPESANSQEQTGQVSNESGLARLYQRQWQLVQLAGTETLKGKGGKPVSLRFEPQKQQVSGFAGCNRYFGAYTIKQNALNFGHLAMTKMLCQQGMELEAKFAKAITQVSTYRFSEQFLELIDQQGETIARFKQD